MPAQLDEGGAAALRHHVEALGITVRTDHQTMRIDGDGERVTSLTFADGEMLPTDMVVFSAGIRPRDELARSAGLAVGERGGIVVDEACRTSDPHVWAIGECALAQDRIWGLVGTRLRDGRGRGRPSQRQATRCSRAVTCRRKLKLLGVDVASVGDPHGATEGCVEVVVDDPTEHAYQKVVLSPDGAKVAGRRAGR